MEIRLKTNTYNPLLRFINTEKYQDNSGFGALIHVQSSGFNAEVFCTFEPLSMEMFVTELQSLNQTLVGKATLKPQRDNWFITFTMTSNGHVTVTGILYSGNQELKYEFTTDQTCLGKLISDLTIWWKL